MLAEVVATSHACKFKTGPLPLFRAQAKKVSACACNPRSNQLQPRSKRPPLFEAAGKKKERVHKPIPPCWGESKVKPRQPVRALAKVGQVLAHAPRSIFRGPWQGQPNDDGERFFSPPPHPRAKKTPPTLGLHAHIIFLGFTPYHTRVIGLLRLT